MKATIQGEKGKELQKSTSLILPVLGVLLLAVCGFFLLFLTRRTFIPADFDGSLEALQTMAAPSMPVLGLLMGLGLYLLGGAARARALELVPAPGAGAAGAAAEPRAAGLWDLSPGSAATLPSGSSRTR